MNPSAFIIFGATGDLANRKLLPALFKLYFGNGIHEDTIIIGFGRKGKTQEQFVDDIKNAVQKNAKIVFKKETWEQFSQKLHYFQSSYEEPQQYHSLFTFLKARFGHLLKSINLVFYLAVPPALFQTIIKNLHATGLAEKGNPQALEHLNKILDKIEQTVRAERTNSIRRGKTLLDVNYKVGRNADELARQHKDIEKMNKSLSEIGDIDNKVTSIGNSLTTLFGIAFGEKDKTRISSIQSKMLEVIDLDATLKPQEQKILRYLVIDKYDLSKNHFKPAYFNEIKRNARIRKVAIKGYLNNLIKRELLQSMQNKNKLFFFVNPKFFGNEADRVKESLKLMGF